jgi:hypothetical protein
MRRSALARIGLLAGDLVDGQIEFNNATWRIKSVLENGNELRLILMAAADGEVPVHLLTQSGDRRITEAGDFRILN